ncbi:uncharacterized protein LOC129806769 [Phlebotomus papatasi]|uniref:uncharacterized protein LOC129806769 n=1 Tax=Phlebotomus papatasi TaxID=29031 RepID=UPI0024833D66|nr:uncharacterized protein LOC129806769 [Phlebotomus papatasi]
MRILRRSLGLTLKDKVKNDRIRESLGVQHITEKSRERRLRWYGHIMRRGEDHIVRRTMEIKEMKRGPGRPPTAWKSTINTDMRRNHLVNAETQERATWSLQSRRADPR